MSNKKVKGRKVDLATFVGSSSGEIALPSAPDPNREPSDGRRGRDGGGRGDRMGGGRGDRGDRGDRNDRGSDRGFASGGGGGDDDWSKSRRPPQREEGRGSGNSFGGGGGGGGEEAESDWRREPASGGSRGFSGGGGGGGFMSNSGGGGGFSGGGSGGFSGAGPRRDVPFASERPKLKLDARSSSQPEIVTSTTESSATNDVTKGIEAVALSAAPPSDPQADKWNNVLGKFKSSTQRSTLPPRAPEGQSDFGRFSSARPTGGDGFGSGGSRFGDRKPSDFSGGGSSFASRDSGSRYGGGDARGGSGFGDRGGSSYGDRGSSGGYRGNDVVDPRFNFSPSSSSHHDSAASALPSFGPTAEEIKAAEDLKIAKANKAAERAEAERKINEAKTAAKEAAALALEVARGAAEIAAGAATEAFMTGLKGEALASHINAMEVKPSGAALIAVILSNLQDPVSIKWCRIAEFGAAIKSLVVGNSKLQLSALHAVQIHLHALKFPKVMDKQKMQSVIAMTFMSLYNFEIVDSAGFSLWADDDDDSSGKIDAIVQTTSFFQYLQEEENGDDEEEDDDDEIDAPRPTIK